MTSGSRFIASVAFVLFASQASAQATPPPPTAPPAPTPRPVTGSAQFSLLQTHGNTDTSIYGLGAEIKYKGSSPWAIGAKALLNRGKVNGTENLNNLAAALRGSRAIDDRTDFFAEGAYAEDKYAGIDSRRAGELGLARKLAITEPHLLSIEVGFGLAHEVRLPGKTKQDFGFGRGGFTYKWVISKAADFQNQANYISNLKQTNDWRFTNLAAVTAALRGKFSLKVSHALNHLNTPPIGKKKTDSIISAALIAKF
ncbi:MAG: DUF481 domain-containing protein [Vicinamibacteria bacterium]